MKGEKILDKGHSEDYFGEYRNHWWNQDFLDLMAERLKLKSYSKVLDVGCGKCHWSGILVDYLSKPTEIIALDQDVKWAQGNKELRQYFNRKDATIDFVEGDVKKLPFPDNAFDMVTCQTVLIHVNNPRLAISEMKRVLKPGGLILCAEPNNMVQQLTKSSVSEGNSIDEILDHVKYALICEHGKKRLGKGDSSLGDLLPGILAEFNFKKIDVCMSDKAIPMYPPYQNKEQKATLDQWSRPNSYNVEGGSDFQYFEAFGQQYLDFYQQYHEKYSDLGEQYMDSLEDHEYHAAGGAMMYLISGINDEE